MVGLYSGDTLGMAPWPAEPSVSPIHGPWFPREGWNYWQEQYRAAGVAFAGAWVDVGLTVFELELHRQAQAISAEDVMRGEWHSCMLAGHFSDVARVEWRRLRAGLRPERSGLS